MALSTVGSVTVFQGSGTVTSFAINKNTGVLPGDLLLWSHVGQTITISPGAPAGFVAVQSGSISGVYEAVYSRIIDGSEGATFTTQTLTSSKYASTMIALRGADPTAFLNVTVPAAITGTTAHTFPAITPVSAGAWALAFGGEQFASGVAPGAVSSTNLTLDGTATSTAGTVQVISAVGHFAWTSGAFTANMTNAAVLAKTVSISVAVCPLRKQGSLSRLQAVNRAASF